MSKPVSIRNLQGKSQDVTPGKGYPATDPEDGRRGYIVYDDKGAGIFTAYPQKYDPTQERKNLEVVSGGTAGYKSQMPKPTPQKGETADQLAIRMKKWEKSQALSSTLTSQVKAKAAEARKKAEADAKADASPVTPPAETKTEPKTSPEPSKTPTNASEAPTDAKPKPEASKAPTPMQQWAKNFPKLAAKVEPGQSGYDEINNKKATPVTPKPNLDDLRKAATQATMAGPSKEAQALMSDRTKNILGPEKLQAGIEGQKRVEKMKKAMESYDAYDLVLEYLFLQGHVDTISEAHYIMMQMSEEYIQDIVESFT